MKSISHNFPIVAFFSVFLQHELMFFEFFLSILARLEITVLPFTSLLKFMISLTSFYFGKKTIFSDFGKKNANQTAKSVV